MFTATGIMKGKMVVKDRPVPIDFGALSGEAFVDMTRLHPNSRDVHISGAGVGSLDIRVKVKR